MQEYLFKCTYLNVHIQMQIVACCKIFYLVLSDKNEIYRCSSLLITECVGFIRAGVGSRRGCLCEERPGTAPCQGQRVPAGSITDPPQHTAESIIQAGGTFGKTCLGSGKKCCRAAVKEKSENVKTALQTPRSVKKG